jgi:hypothetical protein
MNSRLPLFCFLIWEKRVGFEQLQLWFETEGAHMNPHGAIREVNSTEWCGVKYSLKKNLTHRQQSDVIISIQFLRITLICSQDPNTHENHWAPAPGSRKSSNCKVRVPCRPSTSANELINCSWAAVKTGPIQKLHAKRVENHRYFFPHLYLAELPWISYIYIYICHSKMIITYVITH